MSENEKGDGLMIGILVVFVVLVIGGLGVLGLGFVRVSRTAVMERDMAEMMRAEAERQRAVAEAARIEAEAARDQMENIENRAVPVEKDESATPAQPLPEENQP